MKIPRVFLLRDCRPRITPITSVLFRWHGCALFVCGSVAIVTIESNVPPSRNQLQGTSRLDLGVSMRIMHLCYAAVGFAVARWIFRRQALPVADPVSRFRTSGLL